MTGRMSRAERQALARQDRAFVAAALVPGNARSFEAHLRHTALLLRDRRALSPCADAVLHVTGLFERSMPDAARAQLACAKGCSFCCHQRVLVTAPEAFLLAGHIRERPDTIAAIAEAVARLINREPGRLPWPRCPLLGVEGACSVYAARPLACHAYVSVDVEDCKNGPTQGGDAIVREPRDTKNLRDLCRMIMLASLRAAGLPDDHYELAAAVDTALKTDRAEKRWLDGENIFAGLPVIPLSADADRLVAQTASDIAPTL